MNLTKIFFTIFVGLLLFVTLISADDPASREGGVLADEKLQDILRAFRHVLTVAKKTGWEPCLSGLFNFFVSQLLPSNDMNDKNDFFSNRM